MWQVRGNWNTNTRALHSACASIMLVHFIRRYVCSSALSAKMAELNLDKCLEAAVEVARQAGKVSKTFYVHDPDSVRDQLTKNKF